MKKFLLKLARESRKYTTFAVAVFVAAAWLTATVACAVAAIIEAATGK